MILPLRREVEIADNYLRNYLTKEGWRNYVGWKIALEGGYVRREVLDEALGEFYWHLQHHYLDRKKLIDTESRDLYEGTEDNLYHGPGK